MRKHIMAITYLPKIDPIRSGKCTQTIRKGDKVHADDQILFHGWSGLPYRSKWTWRKRITVLQVINVHIDYKSGLKVLCPNNIYFNWFRWDSPEADKLAALDFIDPPTGIELRNVLFKLNRIKNNDGKYQYQIIRWGNND